MLLGAAWVMAVVLAAGGCGSGTSTTNGFGADGGLDGQTLTSGGQTHESSSSGFMLKGGSSSKGAGCGLETCESRHANCGPVSDGCGNILQCGSCKKPETCGGGGPSRCGIPDGSSCKPKTCSEQGFTCGPQGDGCGGTIASCGTCTGTDTCGGGGKPGVCGSGDGGACVPNTCSGLHATCGVQSDGCGGTLSCGTCTGTDTCGGGGKPNQCGSHTCTPKTCANAGAGGTPVNCGVQSDGCSSTINCGSCSGTDTCGGGGTPSVCGSSDGGPACVPGTCTSLNVNCGMVGDGCGGTLTCGTCTGGETCGGAGVSNQCGNPSCTPTTCTALSANCGIQSDGCGGTLNCGTCNAPDTCGGGGVPNNCGGCAPATCSNVGPGGTAVNCGPIGDGCGGLLNCGTCSTGQVCGGGATPTPNICGSLPACVPLTCANAGPGMSALNCGSASDGCGGTLTCGTCTAPQACGGGGQFGVCGCTGTCSEIVGCPGGGSTTITGNVYDPADRHPIYNALVYVPNDPTDPALDSPFPAGVVCDQCGAAGSAAGQPLFIANTAVDGSFTIPNVNVAAGTAVPVVIQNGRWREMFTVTITNPCGQNAISQGNTQLTPYFTAGPQAIAHSGHLTFPTNSGIGDIPRIGILSGSYDMVECELRKIGIADSEFGNPSTWGSGSHVQFYRADESHSPGAPGGTGALISSATPAQAQMFATDAVTGNPNINQYDLVINECEGYPETVPGGPNPADGNGVDEQAVLGNYAGAGGRVLASDFAYDWLFENPAFQAAANWGGNHSGCGFNVNANIDPPAVNPVSTPFEQWLALTGVVGSGGTQFPLVPAFPNVVSVAGQTVEWLNSSTGEYYPYYCGYDYVPTPIPIHMTFNTPITAAPANQCGLVVYSDWHTQSGLTSQGFTFPDECTDQSNASYSPTVMSDQETILEFMLFNATSCVTPYTASCVPGTCTTEGFFCGSQGDGCGNIIDCGSCSGTDLCIGGACTPSCTPATCASLLATSGINCGMQGDGCGGTLDCGSCPNGETCGGGGSPGVCGGIACIPKTCAEEGINCGAAGDGCGGTLSCGTCGANQTCGGGGPGKCGTGCIPKTCSNAGAGGTAVNCGPVGDGCGNILDCGTCSTGTCGGGGQGNVCGTGGNCTPQTCTSLGINCGEAGDGCGGTITCGTCTAPNTCGGGGTSNVCGTSTCHSATCNSLGFNCGPAGDGCGNELECGNCTPPATCGGGGKGNVCGNPSCTPLTCMGLGFNCGSAGDGCGNLLNCGTCPMGETCGANNHPNVCGTSSCTAQTCTSLGYNCGAAGDGCGGTINCGTCTSPQTCGGGGQANVCGGSSGK